MSFFFSRPFHENFKFLKNCAYDFHKILHSHSTPKGAPACSKAKMAKNSPKTAVFRLFLIFAKTVPTIRNEILYSPSTLYYGPLCAISSNSYCWDVRNIAKIIPKMAKKQPFFDFFLIFAKTVHTIRTKISSHFLHHSMVYVCNFNKFV